MAVLLSQPVKKLRLEGPKGTGESKWPIGERGEGELVNRLCRRKDTSCRLATL